MAHKNTVVIRAREKERIKLNSLCRECSALEGKKVTTSDILERTLNGEDILARLKQGSIKRSTIWKTKKQMWW